jgi:hypothetical protein
MKHLSEILTISSLDIWTLFPSFSAVRPPGRNLWRVGPLPAILSGSYPPVAEGRDKTVLVEAVTCCRLIEKQTGIEISNFSMVRFKRICRSPWK